MLYNMGYSFMIEKRVLQTIECHPEIIREAVTSPAAIRGLYGTRPAPLPGQNAMTARFRPPATPNPNRTNKKAHGRKTAGLDAMDV